MQDLNIDMLKTKIYNLMQENRVTQETLSGELGMSQSNFSRALSLSNSQCFTLEQVYKIAQYFEMSVDQLLGNTKPADKQSEKDICKFFTDLIESRKIVTSEITRNEFIYYPYYSGGLPDCETTKEDVKYTSFVFPSYFDPGPADCFDPGEIEDLECEYLSNGNRDESNMRINEFFTKYLQIYNMYLHNQMTEELFHEITEKFMQDLK